MYLTIDGFEKLSKQEIFDMSVAHIASTRKKSIAGTHCVYSGSGCAAACFLKPKYRKNADTVVATQHGWPIGTGWSDLQYREAVPKHEEGLVSWLQNCHDRAPEEAFMQQWKDAMRKLAAHYGLSTEKLDAVPV